MNKELKKIIRFILHYYWRNKESLKLRHKTECKYWQMVKYMVCGVDEAIASMPASIKQYAQMRYFEQSFYERSYAAGIFGVTPRTINRWDSRLLTCVAINIGLIKK